MRDLLGTLKNITFVEPKLTLRSALAQGQEPEIEALAEAIRETV